MKKHFLLTKTLLVALLCLVGQSVWGAVQVTETYDFGSFITANGTANLTVTGSDIAQSGTSAKVGNVKVINNLVAGGKTLDLKGRFAVDYQYNAGSKIRFIWRSSTNAYQHGLAGNWNGNGTADPQGAARFSILNLKSGDKITLTYAKQSGKAADPYTCNGSILTDVAVDVALSSGTEYTVASDGNVDLYFTNNNFAISKIVIKTTGNETVSNPTFSVTGVFNKTRKVTISAGVSDAANSVTTYYTIDGTTPTTSSPNSFTSSSKEITVGEGAESESTVTVKAISVSSTSAASDVASSSVTVGTMVSLSAPTLMVSEMYNSGAGIYNPHYSFSSNQSSVIGNPSVTYTYSIDGVDKGTATGFNATASGKVIVTANAEGYSSASTAEQDFVGGNYIISKTYDFTEPVKTDFTAAEQSSPSGGTAQSINNTGCTFYNLANLTKTFWEGATLNGFVLAVGTTQGKTQGVYTRGGAGSIAFTISEGQIIYTTAYNRTGNATGDPKSFITEYSTGNEVLAIPQYYLVYNSSIFTPVPATVPATLGTNGYATFASPYALDLTTANLPSGVTAYKASVSGTTVTFTALDQTVPANTGVLLKGTGTVNIPVAATGTAVESNDFLVNDGGATFAGNDSYYYFGLLKDTDPLTFRKFDPSATAIPADKAYLKVLKSSVDATARGLEFVFDDEVTSIGEELRVKSEEFAPAAEFYDLQGRKVAQPTKGLYIVNGKKVVLK